MTDDDHDELTFGKMLEAAAAIKDMARTRPAEASAMLEQAQHLIELAEQIRSDWLRRQGEDPVRSSATLAQRMANHAADRC
ncbi:MAG TPA: hypothetical protein VFA50_13125 [Stellaceae bacterium]|nr:hypothetical protein [Stellaceae bacterium]